MGTRTENINVVIGAKNKASGALSSLKTQIVSIGAAYLSWRAASDIIGASVTEAMNLQSTMQSLKSVVGATGRNMNDVLSEMAKHTGGLATEANIASGFLKGMTTKLTVTEISQLTQAVKDASIAMGEDFNTQLPLIIKAVKQLNPAILDNIGVTVRLDEVNKRIRNGYYGINKEITEATQQHAIFSEIMRQTAQYAGQEAQYLQTAAGQVAQLKVQLSDMGGELGTQVLPAIIWFVKTLREAIAYLPLAANGLQLFWDRLTMDYEGYATNFAKIPQLVQDTAMQLLRIQGIAIKGQGEQTKQGLDQVVGLSQEAIAKLSATGDTVQHYVQEYSHGWKISADEMADAMDGATDVFEDGMRKAAYETASTQRQVQQLGPVAQATANSMASAMVSAASGINSIFEDMRQTATGIWQSMAVDFMQYFVQAVLQIATAKLAAGLLKIIGSLFDTPANDRMAMRQGSDFARFFVAGIDDTIANAQIGSRINVGIGQSLALAAPSGYSAPTSRNDGGIHIHLHAPVISRTTVNEIIPIVERVSRERGSRITLKQRNITGKLDAKLA